MSALEQRSCRMLGNMVEAEQRSDLIRI